MGLQKNLYFLNGIYYNKKSKFLIKEIFEAWPYGPVIPFIYQKYKIFGRNSITLDKSHVEVIIDKKIDTEVINEGLEKLSGYYATTLSKMSHDEDGPWDITRKNPVINEKNIIGVKIEYKNFKIDKKLIENYFKEEK